MQATRQNIHHHKLPNIGETGYVIQGTNRHREPVYLFGAKQKFQVVGFPLCDNVLPYSKGIHTAYLRNLANGQTVKVSGFYFEPEEN